MKKILHIILLISISFELTHAQARLIINNGAYLNLNGGTAAYPIYLVVDNSNTNAIARNISGHIISEGEFNIIKWNMGATNASYSVPFGYSTTDYLPVNFTTSGAAGSGSMLLSTHSGNWKNTDYLPLGVTIFNHNTLLDNSAKVIDRFWRIEPQSYLTKPMLSNLIFTYRDAEHTNIGNSITESFLLAQRYNNTLIKWDDYLPSTTINTTTNKASISSISSNQLFAWWTLTDYTKLLPIELLSFNVICSNSKKQTIWSTASEVNNAYFEVEESQDGITFYTIANVATQNGNSVTEQQYSTMFDNNQHITNYYRLKQTDVNGNYTYSSLVKVACSKTSEAPIVSIYPNPTTAYLQLSIEHLEGSLSYSIYNVQGKEIITKQTKLITDYKEKIDISQLAKATYILQLVINNEFYHAIKFVKE
jgi:hypothetical protein